MDFDYIPDGKILFNQSVILFSFIFIILYLYFRSFFLALVISIIKSSLFFIYYYFFSSNLELSIRPDDIYYLQHGIAFENNFKIQDLNYWKLQASMESFHFFYILPISILINLFGEFYTSLAIGNIILTCFIAILATSIIKEQKYTWYKNFAIFFLLYPDLIAFSTSTAGKDTWVLLMHVLFIKSYSLLINKSFKKSILVFLITFVIALHLRFYIPVIFSFIFIIAYGFSIRILIFTSFLFIALILLTDYIASIKSLFNSGINYIGNTGESIIMIPYGIIHFLLTPLPFNVSQLTHDYLTIPSVINILFLPLFILGFLKTLKILNKFNIFLILYTLSFLITYGFIDFLQGPRHRYQLAFVSIYFIIIGLSTIRIKNKT